MLLHCELFLSPFFEKLPGPRLGIEIFIPLCDHLICEYHGFATFPFHGNRHQVLGSAVPCDRNRVLPSLEEVDLLSGHLSFGSQQKVLQESKGSPSPFSSSVSIRFSMIFCWLEMHRPCASVGKGVISRQNLGILRSATKSGSLLSLHIAPRSTIHWNQRKHLDFRCM
jgi:hypothetical protein